MSTNGVSKTVTSVEDSDIELNHFGADVFSECFGTPEEIQNNPGTLLWLANGLYTVSNTIVEAVTSCRLRPKRD